MRVEVYWNLHRKCWSVRHKGRVIVHASSVSLREVQWVVQPAGREKVRREKRKTVHAFARGTVMGSASYDYEWAPDQVGGAEWQVVTYNPYMDDTFVYAGEHGRTPIDRSAGALLSMQEGRPMVWARVGDD